MKVIKRARRIVAAKCAALLCAATLAHAEVTVQFLGNTTLVFDDGETRIMTDGFLSRLSMDNLLFGVQVETDTKRVQDALDRAGVKDVAAIFVAHAHFDHAMDVKFVANKLGARVYGSRSTRAVAQARSRTNDALPKMERNALLDPLPSNRFEILHDERRYQIGNFTVTPIYTPHGGTNFFPGELRPGFTVPARLKDLRANENYSFHIQNGDTSVLVVPGTNYLTGKLERYSAQTVFLGIGGLSRAARKAEAKGQPPLIKSYWHETVEKVGAHTVIPVHWDNFFVGLDTESQPGATAPLKPARFGLRLDKIMQDLRELGQPERTKDGRSVCVGLIRVPFTKVRAKDPAVALNSRSAPLSCL